MNERQAKCPFCRQFMTGWRSRYPAKACDQCDRPLFLMPSIFKRDHLAILSALDIAKVLMLPVVTGATISFGLGGLTPSEFAAVVAGALLMWGLIDVWDGTAGLKTGIDRVKKQVQKGGKARKTSVAKTIFGFSSVLLGALGLLLII